jgi:hypothetical protein
MLETVRVRSPGLVQRYNFAVDNSVGGKIDEPFSDLRESSFHGIILSCRGVLWPR